MMTSVVRKVYQEAIKSKDFDADMLKQDPTGYKSPPGFFSSEDNKILYACAYYGWLLGKGKYDREKFI
jgi:hypothetical protein